MEAEEIRDSAKEWFNDKLKNPYFAAVFAVWLITNRVVVFSLFNFTDEQNVQQRITLISQQLNNKTILCFQGFYGIILYSFIVGLISMVGFNYVNVLGKWFYNFFGKGANSLKKAIEPLSWVHRSEVEKIIKENDEFLKQIEEQATNIIVLKQEKQIALENLAKAKDGKESEKKELEIILLNKQLEDQKKLTSELINKQESKQLELSQERELNLLSQKSKENKKKELEILLLNKQLEDQKKLSSDLIHKLESKQLKLSQEHELENLISEKSEENEVKNFLKSEYRNFFDIIFGYIKDHKPMGLDVPQYTLDFYHHNGLISIKDNLYILTPKGERYYKEYLKVKETK